ncbi:C-type lectin lectoxin-Lei1-like [Saccoglossus kowalevskii]
MVRLVSLVLLLSLIVGTTLADINQLDIIRHAPNRGNGRPQHGQSANTRPGNGQQGSGRPGHEHQGGRRPGHGQQGNEEPGQEHPGTERPGHAQLGNVRVNGPYFDEIASYIISVDKLPWEQAWSFCERAGGMLAEPKEENTNTLLEGVLDNSDIYGPFWIGLNDLEEEGNIVWSSGLGVTFADWRQQGSKNHPRRDCVVIRGKHGHYTWSFKDCSTRNKFICELPIVGGNDEN